MPVKAGYLRDEDRDVEAVVLLDEVSQDSIEVQQALAFDEQDIENGTDTYCLVRGGGMTCYGGVASFTHDAVSITFEFTDAAAEALELPSLVTIEIDPDQLEPVLPVLQRLLTR